MDTNDFFHIAEILYGNPEYIPVASMKPSTKINAVGVEDALMKNMEFCPTSFKINGIGEDIEVEGYLTPKKEEEIPMTLPKIVNVYFNMKKMTTTILWADKTSTTVKLGDGETFDRYAGFCACIVKRLFGTTGKGKELMNSLDHDLIVKQKQEEKEARAKAAKEAAEAGHKRRIKRIAKNMRDQMEASVMVMGDLVGSPMAQDDAEQTASEQEEPVKEPCVAEEAVEPVISEQE